MKWKNCRIVAFDTETTGLNPFDGDRVIEFGAVELIIGPSGHVTDVEAQDIMINPEMPIPRAASRISGIVDDDVADAPVFAKVADRVIELLDDAILVAHNLVFDLNFVRVELGRCGKHWPKTRAEVDTLPLSQRLLSQLRSHKLENICRHLGVPLDNAHRATHDAEATGRSFVELANRHGAPEDLWDMVEWADAVSPPPDTGHLIFGDKGTAEFVGGPFAGQSVEAHPDYLQWMTLALERRDQRWQHRFPESVRGWARRWLRARCAGWRDMSRNLGSQDWNIEPPVSQ